MVLSWLVFVLMLGLAGCAMSSRPAPPVIYDFGPGAARNIAPTATDRLPALMLDVIEASPALDSTALLYRLNYIDSQQLRPYALARWSATPAQLLRLRLRQHLSQRRAMLNPGESVEADAATPALLQIELEEFSQLFNSAAASSGLLRLRATVTRPGPKGGKWLAQRSLVVQREAPTPDASGGVRALTAAADAAALEIDQWLQAIGQ